jgi:hypothetical protein
MEGCTVFGESSSQDDPPRRTHQTIMVIDFYKIAENL